jgi:hypothetical protein
VNNQQESHSNSNNGNAVQVRETDAMPTSIFNNEFIFEKSQDEVKAGDSSSLGEPAQQQEDPSSSECKEIEVLI